MGHLVDGQTTHKDYISQAFNEALDEYYIDNADNTWVLLSFDNPANSNQRPIDALKSIDLESGYWLINHDFHTGDWMFWHYKCKSEAKIAYKNLYCKYFKHQEWYWTVKIG